ncbi:MAG: YggS family pyridoxal phosphate-dependent enzyme [Clostridiales bacterium]|jgi:pyridoxal phosphate enzyme (YggS family)|nr:YggS family pyridoxal phosphate-dependent enzyme [Clostridiales bacterium]
MNGMDYIVDNVRRIQDAISQAAAKSGRPPEDVTLVGVTKTIDIPRIQALLDLGVVNLGENKPQELCGKYAVLGDCAHWHLIGHLQTNKVKSVIDKASMIHSVDSLRLAEEIDKRSKSVQKIMDVLIEVNIAGEFSKQGVEPEKTLDFIDSLLYLTNIHVCGLMCIAPYVDNPEKNRNYFVKMKQLFIDANGTILHNKEMKHLSMGMSNDFQIAVEEGATMVRIGTGIFGERFYV